METKGPKGGGKVFIMALGGRRVDALECHPHGHFYKSVPMCTIKIHLLCS